MKTITDEQFEKYEYALVAMESRENINFILEKIMFDKDPEVSPDGTFDNPSTLKEVKLPKEGGILSYYNEHTPPRKGFPVDRLVDRVNVVKKVIVAMLYGLTKNKVILAITLLFFRKDLQIAYTELLHRLRTIIGFNALLPNRYCTSVREVYKAFEQEDWELRDIAVTILEFDDAYRFRFQDIVGELDKQNFDKNPYKELSRLLELIEFRDNDQRLKSTWKKARQALFLVFFVKSFREKIITFFSKVNPENVKMYEDYMYYAKLKVHSYGYRWGESPVS